MIGGAGERELLGRDEQLSTIHAALTRTGPGLQVVLLTGQAGIGKTALWEAGVAAAGEHGHLVLQSRASESEVRLSHGGLGDLLEHVGAKELAGLPLPQRRAVETALLWDEHGAVDPRALGAGFLAIVRALVATGAVLIAVDDEQWLDAASVEAVTYALRRLRDEHVTVLLTRRTERPEAPYGGDGLAPHLARLPAGVSVLEVPPLRPEAIRRLVGQSLPARQARRVFELSGGNPFFALEIAGALHRADPPVGSSDELPVPSSLHALISARLAAASSGSGRAVLVTALMSSPRLGPVRDVLARDDGGGTEPGDADLEGAAAGGLLVIQRDHVRLAHPLLGAVARAEASAARCRHLHHLIAAASVDVEERARHRALGAVPTDDAVADELAHAADLTAGRGGVRAAAELSEQAWRFTSRPDPRRATRLLTAVERYFLAGLFEPGIALLAPELETLPPGPLRARARLRIAQMRLTDLSPQQYDEVMAEADPRLRAETLADRASNGVAYGTVPVSQARRWTAEAVELSAGLDDPAPLARCVTEAAFSDALLGVDPEPWLAGHDLGAIPNLPLHDQGGRIRAMRAIWRGEVAHARQLLDALMRLAQQREEEMSAIVFTLNLFDIAIRVGDWTAAAQVQDDLVELGASMIPPELVWRVQAAVAAGTGDRALAAESLRLLEDLATERGPEPLFWHLLLTRRAAGQAALFDGDAETAVALLSSVVADAAAGDYRDPGVFPAAPDLIEALVKAGRLDDARDALSRLEEIATEQDHPWALAGAARARGILLSAPAAKALPALDQTTLDKSALDDAVEAALNDALDRYRYLGLPFDEARTIAALATLRRRQRRFRDARTLLYDAAEQFEHLGALGLARTTRAEATRAGGPAPNAAASTGGLTATEQQVVDLVIAGHTNRRTAERLFISTSAVEAHLTRIYAKLGVSSRTQLARHLSGPAMNTDAKPV